MVALGFFSWGLLAPLVARRLGGRGLALTAGGLGLARLAEQASGSPAADLWIAGVGVGLFSLYLPLHAMLAGKAGVPAGPRLAAALLVGIAGDTALRAVLRTLDLSWQEGTWPLLIVAPAALLLIAAAARAGAGALAASRRPSSESANPLAVGGSAVAPAGHGSTGSTAPVISPGAGTGGWARPPRGARRVTGRLALLGPWLFLQLLLFQNAPAVAAATDRPLPAAALAVGTGGALGLGLLAAGRVWPCMMPPWLAAAGTALGLGLASSGAGAGLAGTALGSALSFALLPWLLAPAVPNDARRSTGAWLPGIPGRSRAPHAATAARSEAGPRDARDTELLPGNIAGNVSARSADGRPRRRGLLEALSAGTPAVLLLALLFLHYGGYDYPLPVSPSQTVALAAGLLLAGALFSRAGPGSTSSDQSSAPPAGLLALGAVVALAGPLLLAASWRTPRAAAQPASLPLRVMTYNLHQGFDLDGRLGPEALARTIEASGAQVVALQEVSRGWVVNGSFDLLEWLAERLGMEARFGATAGPWWGNAVLSRVPFGEVVARPLPPAGLALVRGYLDAEIDAEIGAGPGGPLRLLATHFHHPRLEGEVRELQARVLLEAWGGSPRTVVAGDLNDVPGSAALAAFAAAGLHRALELLPPAERDTHHNPGRREIDYLWATPDLAFSEVAIPFSTASDHLPVVATVGPAPATTAAGATAARSGSSD